MPKALVRTTRPGIDLLLKRKWTPEPFVLGATPRLHCKWCDLRFDSQLMLKAHQSDSKQCAGAQARAYARSLLSST
jgi:hypothetical protein